MNQRCREVSALELKSKVLIYTVNLITEQVLGKNMTITSSSRHATHGSRMLR